MQDNNKQQLKQIQEKNNLLYWKIQKASKILILLEELTDSNDVDTLLPNL